MNRLVTFVGKINLGVGWLAAPLTLFITIFVLWEVFARYFFNAPTTWSNEVNGYLLCGLVMLGGGYTLKKHAHTRVDIAHQHLSPRTRAWIEVLTGVIVFMFTSPIIYYGAILTYESIETGETSVSAAQLPLWPSQAVVPLGAILLFLQGLANALEAVEFLMDEGEQPGSFA